jgi:hypothetical protein
LTFLTTQALPSRPLNIISLADADEQTSLNFVAGKLKLGTPGHATLTEEEKSRINVLGGRMNGTLQAIFPSSLSPPSFSLPHELIDASS